MIKPGPYVFVDFYKISRPCTCIVTPSFDGELLVVSKRAVKYACNTEVVVQNTSIGCSTNVESLLLLNVTINQTVKVRARYVSPSTSGTFQHCFGFQRNAGIDGNLKVICGSPSETTVATIVSSTPIITSPIEPSASVAINNKTTDATRSRSTENKERSLKGDKAHKTEIFVSNPELSDNPLYISSQPMNELGYSSDQEKQLGLPPTDSNTKKKFNSNCDVPANNKLLDHGASSLPVYAISKKSKDRASEVRSGDVYAEVCKPTRGTAQFPVRKPNEDGLLYTEVVQNPGATKLKQTPMTEIK
uniref:Uncharacterized protein n=1 Tax=Magallana gigas TaxID=29159 RepID=A0A8W8JBS6_MAGGI